MKDGDLYRPSNGTEGMSFMEDHCDQCIHQAPLGDHFKEKNCDINLRSMCYGTADKEYPKEWCYMGGRPTCTNFVKWDWGNDGDPDDPDNPKAPPPPPDPNQLDLFPLFPTEKTFEHESHKADVCN